MAQRPKQTILAKHWCGTSFARFTKDDWLKWEETAEGIGDWLQYIVVGMEECPTTKKPHGQWYLQLVKRQRRTPVQRLLGLTDTNLQICRGTPLANYAYCVKGASEVEGSGVKPPELVYEWGTMKSGQGRRTDIADAVQTLRDGGSLLDVLNNAPSVFVHNHAGLAKARALMLEEHIPNIRKVKVIVLWGPTGTGKTHTAVKHSDSVFKIQAFQLRKANWDTYEGQSTLVIDEFSNKCCDIVKMLAYTDIYKLRLWIMYGYTFAQWGTVIITTNLKWPEEIYPGANPANRDALFRRIGRVVHMDKPWREMTPVIFTDSENEEEKEGDPEPVTLVRQNAMFIDSDEEREIGAMEALI